MDNIMKPYRARPVEHKKKYQVQKDWAAWWTGINYSYIFGIELLICLNLAIPLLYIQFTIEFYHLDSYLKCIRGFYILFLFIPNFLLIVYAKSENKFNHYLNLTCSLTNLLLFLIFVAILLPFRIPPVELSDGECQAKWIFRNSSGRTDQLSYAYEGPYIIRFLECVLSNTGEVLELLSLTRFILFLNQYLWIIYCDKFKRLVYRVFSNRN